jgi:hypothetical protein
LVGRGSSQLELSSHPSRLRPTHFVCHPSRSGGSALSYGLSSRGAAEGSALSSAVILSGVSAANAVEGPLSPPGCSRPTLETRNSKLLHYPLSTNHYLGNSTRLPSSPRACAPWPARSSPTRSTCFAPTHSTRDSVERRFSAALRCLYCFVVITRGPQPPRDLLFTCSSS